MKLKQIVDKAEFDPNKLFLIDGFGAILSAFLLGVVLVKLERHFGIPSSALYFLAIFPIIFAIYDFYCYRQVSYKRGKFLKGIAVANLLYCCLSIGVLFYHIETITSLGWIYILVEILIVIFLASVELITANRLMNNESAHSNGYNT